MNIKDLKPGTKVKVGNSIKVFKSLERNYDDTYHVIFMDGFNDNYYINGRQEYIPAISQHIEHIKENIDE